jgi:FdhD protein
MEQRMPVKATTVKRYSAEGGKASQLPGEEDLLVVEEPLEIRLEYGPREDRQQRNVAVTMRTPGHDLELAAGFLHGEGILKSREDIFKIGWCANVQLPEEYGNVVKVDLQPGVMPDLDRLERNFYTSSSCGVCGKASIAALGMAGCPVVLDAGMRVSADLIRKLPERALASQTVFKHTGGLHAASIFDETGNTVVSCEDVGRHNALDKAIGGLFLQGKVPLRGHILLVSGRASFELVQKGLYAGIPVMAAVGAPSSLAVDLAREHGMTLIGFLRGDRFNVYAGGERIVSVD